MIISPLALELAINQEPSKNLLWAEISYHNESSLDIAISERFFKEDWLLERNCLTVNYEGKKIPCLKTAKKSSLGEAEILIPHEIRTVGLNLIDSYPFLPGENIYCAQFKHPITELKSNQEYIGLTEEISFTYINPTQWLPINIDVFEAYLSKIETYDKLITMFGPPDKDNGSGLYLPVYTDTAGHSIQLGYGSQLLYYKYISKQGEVLRNVKV